MKIKLLTFMLMVLLLTSCSNFVKKHNIVINIKTVEHGDIILSNNVTINKDNTTLSNILSYASFNEERYSVKGVNLDGSLKEFLDLNSIIKISDGLRIFVIVENISNPFLISSVGRINIYSTLIPDTKENYVDALIEVSDKTYDLKRTNVSFRLRGNSSFTAPKKSYKLKFKEDVNLFGMGEDTEWALIANYYDPSFIRNYLAYKLAFALGIKYSVECKFVEVYLNEQCLGLYLLTETVKASKNRVDIKTNYTSNDEEIPFLIELDRKMVSELDPWSNGVLDVDYFMSQNNIPFGTKYPKDFSLKNITTKQYNYIKKQINDIYNNLHTNNFDNYFDINSAILYYAVQEIMMNIDLNYSSVYMYKEVGKPLMFGPVWDFDISLGNCNYVDHYSPFMMMKDVNGGSEILNAIINNQKTLEMFVNTLKEIKKIYIPKLLSAANNIYQRLLPYVTTDDLIWHNQTSSYWPKPEHLVGISYEEQVNYCISYLQTHLDYLITSLA